MVSDTVVGAAIGVSGAVVGSLLTGLFNWIATKQKIEAENRRHHAEFYLEDKVDTLTELSSKLWEAEDWISVTLLAQSHSHETGEERIEVNGGGEEVNPEDDLYPLVRDFQRQLSDSHIYLDKHEMDALRDCVSDLWDAYKLIDSSKSVSKEDVDELFETIHNARILLKKEINGPIQRIESE